MKRVLLIIVAMVGVGACHPCMYTPTVGGGLPSEEEHCYTVGFEPDVMEFCEGDIGRGPFLP